MQHRLDEFFPELWWLDSPVQVGSPSFQIFEMALVEDDQKQIVLRLLRCGCRHAGSTFKVLIVDQ